MPPVLKNRKPLIQLDCIDQVLLLSQSENIGNLSFDLLFLMDMDGAKIPEGTDACIVTALGK